MDPTRFGWESDELSFGSTNDASPHGYKRLSRLDRCDRVIPNESRFQFGGNLYYVTMQITFLMRTLRNVERNLQCDVVHFNTKWLSSLNLDCNDVFAINAYCTAGVFFFTNDPVWIVIGKSVLHVEITLHGVLCMSRRDVLQE